MGEHRSDPITVRIPGVGGATFTRVRGVSGVEHVEIHLSLRLHPAEPVARRQLGLALAGLRSLLHHHGLALGRKSR